MPFILFIFDGRLQVNLSGARLPVTAFQRVAGAGARQRDSGGLQAERVSAVTASM